VAGTDEDGENLYVFGRDEMSSTTEIQADRLSAMAAVAMAMATRCAGRRVFNYASSGHVSTRPVLSIGIKSAPTTELQSVVCCIECHYKPVYKIDKALGRAVGDWD
jgi:hypothetical protein